MARSNMFWLPLLAVTNLFAVVFSQPCNPLENACPNAIPGFTAPYSIDFSQQTTLPADWISADSATVTFDDQMGAKFSFVKRYDAPYIWTRNYFLFGRVDVELQAAPGNGLITGAVVMSDDKDELDWEFSGNNFGHGQANGLVQTNWFGKGITGSYSRGTQQAVDNPQTTFHTYSYEWTKEGVKWILDGNVIHSIQNNGDKSGEFQFPQTPARLHLGIWNAGDPDTPAGTMNWAGGLLDMTKVPYSAYVKSVKITPYKPCSSWQYPSNYSGNWQDVKCTNQTVAASTPASAPTSTSLSSTNSSAGSVYTVKAGDSGQQIATSLVCSFGDLQIANPGVNWNLLLVGQTLNVPGAPAPSALANSTASGVNAAATSNGAVLPTTSLYNAPPASNLSSTAVLQTTTSVYTGTNTVATFISTGSGPSATLSSCATVTVTVTAPCNAMGSSVVPTGFYSTNPVADTFISTTTQVQSAVPTGSYSTSLATGMLISTTAQIPSAAPTGYYSSYSAASSLLSTTAQTQSAAPTGVYNTSVLTGASIPTTTQTQATIGVTSTIYGTASPTTQLSATTGSLQSMVVYGQNSTSRSPTLPLVQTQGIILQTEMVASSSIVPSTILPSQIALPGSSGQMSYPSQSAVSSYYAPNTVTQMASPSMATIWTTKLTMSTVTVTAPCTVCQTITSGGQVTTSCSRSMNTTVTATQVQTVIPVTTQLSVVPTSAPPLPAASTSLTFSTAHHRNHSHSEMVKHNKTAIPTAPFLTTVTVPCSSCAKGVKTVTSLCSEATAVATVTVPCPVCEGGVRTTTTTTTISLTQPPFFTSPPFLNSSTVVDLKQAQHTTANSTSLPHKVITPVKTNTTHSTAKISSSVNVHVYLNSSISTSGRSSKSTATISKTETTTSALSSSTSHPLNTTSQSMTTYPSTSKVKTTTSSTISTTSTTSIVSTKPKSSTPTVSSTTSVLSTAPSTVPPTTTTPGTTTSSVPPVCSQDACLNNMLDGNHIEDAHSYAHDFCSDRAKPTPTWLTACENKASATSAFQCVTASATPVPSQDQDGRKCFDFKGQKIWGKGYGQESHQTWQAWHKREEHDEESKGYLGRLWRFNKGRPHHGKHHTTATDHGKHQTTATGK